ncbi:MAG: flippase [Patescibacteria group bacterium]|nr:flippase [Patescibacteria group bacterium]MDD5490846.1 flippase [Patescibacteria group bacterium]
MSSFVRQIAHNTIIQVIGKGISTLLGLGAVVIMTRYLGQEGYGQYTTITSFLQFFGIIVDFGLTLITAQMISRPGVDQKKILSNIFTLRFWSALIFLGLAPLAALFFPYPAVVKIGIAFTALSFFFIALQQVQVGIFQKNLRMDKVMLAEISGRVVLVAGTALAAYWGQGVLCVMWAIVAGSFVNWLINFIFARGYARYSWAYDFDVWKEVIKLSWPLGVSIIFNLIYLKADIIILSLVRPQAEVGLYGAPYKVIDVLTMIPMMFSGLLLPVFTSDWAQQNLERLKRIYLAAFDVMAMSAIPLIVGAQFLGERLMVLIAGPEFLISGSLLRILILAQGFIFFGTLFGHLVIALNKQRVMMWGYVITAIASLAAYIIFIPIYSYYGAAWGTVFSEALICVLTFIVVTRATKIRVSFGVLGKSVVASLLMGAVLYYFKDLNVFILALISFVVYFPALYLLGGIDKKLFREIISLK